MRLDPNGLYHQMTEYYLTQKTDENRLTICNEGSSRSGKTWDTWDFIKTFCDHNRGKELEIYILRNTLTDCRDYTFKEFKKSMVWSGIWDESKAVTTPKPYYNLWGNHLYFRGLDKTTEAPPSEIIFVNGSLEVETEAKIKGWRMRCNKLMIFDWNPKFTQHWCFTMEGRPNTLFTHSTFRDNKHLEKAVANEIIGYDPNIPENVINGTADDFQYKVYNLGIRTASEGVIFKNINYIDEWPEEAAITRGLDFGYTVDPSALVDYGELGNNIYIRPLMYEPTETASIIDQYALAQNIDTLYPCTADSADRYAGKDGVVYMVRDLKEFGWRIEKVRKTNTIMYWLNSMKEKNINVVKNELVRHAKDEFQNYRFRTVNGIQINQPIDGYDHLISAARYAHMGMNQPYYKM